VLEEAAVKLAMLQANEAAAPVAAPLKQGAGE
jgi:hypothetical protein